MDLPAETEARPGEISRDSWTSLVERIRQQDATAMEQLYRIFSKGIRFLLCRQLGSRDLDDKVHDVFLIVTQSIRKGELREPERLMGYVHTVVRRQVAAHIEAVVQARRCYADLDGTLALCDRAPDPERGAIEHENQQLALRILNSIGERNRELLIRFYLKEESPEEICRAMHLTETQFRLIKWRAKARFGELGRRRLSRRSGFLS